MKELFCILQLKFRLSTRTKSLALMKWKMTCFCVAGITCKRFGFLPQFDFS